MNIIKKSYSTILVISPFCKLRIHDSVNVMINPMKPEEIYGIEYSNELIKTREKWYNLIVKLIISIPLIALVIFTLIVIIVLLFEKYHIIFCSFVCISAKY